MLVLLNFDLSVYGIFDTLDAVKANIDNSSFETGLITFIEITDAFSILLLDGVPRFILTD